MMLEKNIELKDMESVDSEYYNSLLWIKVGVGWGGVKSGGGKGGRWGVVWCGVCVVKCRRVSEMCTSTLIYFK